MGSGRRSVPPAPCGLLSFQRFSFAKAEVAVQGHVCDLTSSTIFDKLPPSNHKGCVPSPMSEGFPFFAMSGNLEQLVSLVNCGELESGL